MVVFLGPPGAGKGTQAERFTEAHALAHVSTGEILRDAVAEGTELGQRTKRYLDSGDLVPDDLMTEVVVDRLSAPDCADGALLDGFPRTVPQAELLDAALDGQGCHIGHVVLIDVPADEVTRRLLARGRSDDNPDTLKNRIDTYTRRTEALIAFYEGRGVLRRVDGVGSVDEVAERVAAAVEEAGT